MASYHNHIEADANGLRHDPPLRGIGKITEDLGESEGMFDGNNPDFDQDHFAPSFSLCTTDISSPRKSKIGTVASSDKLSGIVNATPLSPVFRGAALMNRDLEKYKLLLGKTAFSEAEADELLRFCHSFITNLIRDNRAGYQPSKSSEFANEFASGQKAFRATVKSFTDNMYAKGNKGFPAIRGIEP